MIKNKLSVFLMDDMNIIIESVMFMRIFTILFQYRTYSPKLDLFLLTIIIVNHFGVCSWSFESSSVIKSKMNVPERFKFGLVYDAM